MWRSVGTTGSPSTRSSRRLPPLETAIASNDPDERADALRAITPARLPVVFRGYLREKVDRYLARAADKLRAQ